LVFNPIDSDIIKIGIEQDFSFEIAELKIVKKVYAAVLKDSSCYDFVDMLFVPLYKGMRFPKFDFIAIDECQDLSLIQHRLFFSCMNEGARFIAFGDQRQAIFSFSGTELNSYQLIKDYPNTTELPLSISYRCGKNIIKHAQELVPQIEAFSERGDGSVVHNGSIGNIKDGDVILCRTNAPIVSLACKLLKDGRKAKIKGADFGKNLANLIKESRATDVAGLIKALNKNLDKLEERIKEENPLIDPQSDSEYQRSYDKTQCIKALCENCSTFIELNKRIESIFSDSNGLEGITLSTIHKFKGLEAKNIFIVEPQLIPFPYYLHLPGQKEVERNLDYVARTRAIEKLEYIKDWSSIKKIEKVESGSKYAPPQKLTKKERRTKKLDAAKRKQ
jgi:DNA helicase-2/ATP-dependent DNA helicase PcrA